MFVLHANSVWWSRRIRCATVVGLTSVSLLAGEMQQVFAETPARPKGPKIPKVVEPTEPQSNSSFDAAIRKLLKEAKSAESKGEIDRAVFLAERAAKISSSSSELVKSAKDVSPSATASYARVLRQKRVELAAKQRAAEVAIEAEIAATPPAKKPLSTIEPPAPTRRTDPVAPAAPAIVAVNAVDRHSPPARTLEAQVVEELPAPTATDRAEIRLAADKPVDQRSETLIKTAEEIPEIATAEVQAEKSEIVQSVLIPRPTLSSSEASVSGQSSQVARSSPVAVKGDRPSSFQTTPKVSWTPQSKVTTRTAATVAARPSLDVPDIRNTSKLEDRQELADVGKDREFSNPGPSIQSDEKSELTEKPGIGRPDETSIAAQSIEIRDSRKFRDIRTAVSSEKSEEDEQDVAAPADTTVTATAAVIEPVTPDVPTSHFKVRQQYREIVAESATAIEEDTASQNVARTEADDDEDWMTPGDDAKQASETASTTESSEWESVASNDERPKTEEVVPKEEPKTPAPNSPIAIKLRASYRDPQASKADLKDQQGGPAAAPAVAAVVASNEATADENAVSSTGPEEPVSNSAPQPFKLRSRHRDASATASADTKALQPDVSSSASVDAFDTNAGAQFDPPREEKTTTTAIDAEIAQTSPAGSIKLRSSFRDPQASKADLKNPQDPPATTVAVDSKETTPDEKAASSTQPEVPVKETVPQPFKLRSRHRNSLAATSIDTKTQQPEVFQVASADAGEETGGSLPKDAKTTKIDSEITQAPPSGSIKLRSLYRDSQLKTSLGSDAEKQTGFEETQDESVVVVNHEISSQRENAAPADNSDPVATRPAGTFKLRASFRDPRVTSTGQQTTEKGIPGETVAKPDSTSATSNTDGKRDSGRSTMIQWRSKKNETSTGSDARANEKASAEPTSNVTRQANHHSISMRRSSGASANSTDADIVGSSHGSASEVRRELRGSIWDNASAPPVDGDSGTAGSRVEVRKKAPLPPGGAGIKQTSFSDSERQSRADSVSNANSDSRSVAQPENVTSSTEDSLVTDLDSEASSPSRQNKRPRATEDDHAASTRAILSSGPIERLARLTGIPSSSASALLGVIGIAMLIGGLWMIRATMGFRQS